MSLTEFGGDIGPMNDQDYIRKAVELADGWRISADRLGVFYDDSNQFSWFVNDDVPEFIKDAIAAQLTRQVDALPHLTVLIEPTCSIIRDDRRCDGYQVGFANHEGPDRTMNTIKAIVDSGVLN